MLTDAPKRKVFTFKKIYVYTTPKRPNRWREPPKECYLIKLDGRVVGIIETTWGYTSKHYVGCYATLFEPFRDSFITTQFEIYESDYHSSQVDMCKRWLNSNIDRILNRYRLYSFAEDEYYNKKLRTVVYSNYIICDTLDIPMTWDVNERWKYNFTYSRGIRNYSESD